MLEFLSEDYRKAEIALKDFKYLFIFCHNESSLSS